MKKIIVTIISVIVALSIAIGCIYCFNIETKEQLITIDNKFQITEFFVEGRTTLKKDGNIYLGNNIKELENEFYDIKIINSTSGIIVYLNKLWYEDYNEAFIQDEYLARICRELSRRLNIQAQVGEVEYLMYKYVKDNYLKVRKNEVVEELKLDNIKIKLELEKRENVVKMSIS